MLLSVRAQVEGDSGLLGVVGHAYESRSIVVAAGVTLGINFLLAFFAWLIPMELFRPLHAEGVPLLRRAESTPSPQARYREAQPPRSPAEKGRPLRGSCTASYLPSHRSP